MKPRLLRSCGACSAAFLLLLACSSVSGQEKISGRWPLDSTRQMEVMNPGSTINTDKLEYAPQLSADGNVLFFTSNRPGGKGQHDIWMAKRTGTESEFAAPVSLTEPLNSKGTEGSIAFTADGRTFYLTACYRQDGSGDCDLYEGVMEGGKIVRLRNFQEVNSTGWDAQPWISADGRTLLFVSNRRGGSQGAPEGDIFIARKDADDEWSTPQPLPAPVNSPDRDDSPCMVLNGKAILFSSNRSGGMGGYDLYISHAQPDGSWGTPQNLGSLFNTEEDERFVTANQDCTVIYFSSRREDLGAQGDLDILVGRTR